MEATVDILYELVEKKIAHKAKNAVKNITATSRSKRNASLSSGKTWYLTPSQTYQNSFFGIASLTTFGFSVFLSLPVSN